MEEEDCIGARETVRRVEWVKDRDRKTKGKKVGTLRSRVGCWTRELMAECEGFRSALALAFTVREVAGQTRWT